MMMWHIPASCYSCDFDDEDCAYEIEDGDDIATELCPGLLEGTHACFVCQHNYSNAEIKGKNTFHIDLEYLKW